MATFVWGHHIMAAFWPVGPEWTMKQGMEMFQYGKRILSGP